METKCFLVGKNLKKTLNNSNVSYSVLTYKILIFDNLWYYRCLANERENDRETLLNACLDVLLTVV